MMMDNLIHKLKEELDLRQNQILTGICSDYVQYRTLVAEYKMLKTAIDMALKERAADDEE